MKYIRKNLKIISIIMTIIILIILVCLKIFLINNKNSNVPKEQPKEESVVLEQNEEEMTVIETIYVDIKGAVMYPGVYEIENNKKVIDVVNKAGGLTDNADTSFINLAKQVSNEMVIIIYTKEEIKKYQTKDEIIKIIDKECICPEITNDACINNNLTNNSSKQTDTKNENNTNEDKKDTNSKDEKINLNTATLEELQTLTGVGESKAQAIIDYRKEHGKFNNIEEIKEVSGIGETLYEKIKNNITI